MTTPPPKSSGSSSYMSSETSNEVPREYLVSSTTSLPALFTQGFPFPPQHPPPSTKPLDLHDGYLFNLQQQQSPPAKAAPPAPSSSSSTRLLHEQRLSTTLNILRHIQRTLRQRHSEATSDLAHTATLIAQSTWALFYQSPLDFMSHEMDMLADDTATAIMSDKSPVGIGSPPNRQDGDDASWMEKLTRLRDLRDDEAEMRRRLGMIARQMDAVEGMMRVGRAEQRDALARSDALTGVYQRGLAFTQAASSSRTADGTVDAKTKAAAAAAPKSGFFDWPVPAASSKGKGAAVGTDDEESSGIGSELDGQCKGECCRHLTS